jgi:hypothetical protein
VRVYFVFAVGDFSATFLQVNTTIVRVALTPGAARARLDKSVGRSVCGTISLERGIAEQVGIIIFP